MKSFESFRSLAINHPCTVEPSVYRVDVFRINGPVDKMPCRNLSLGLFNVHVHGDDRDDAEYYPEYNVCKAQSFVMPTFEDAKEFIQSGRISIDDDRPVYCIHIYELPFGKDVISDLCKREWGFDGNCSIINQSVCSSLLEDLDTPEGHFWGRPKETIRFKPGDIVEVHDRKKDSVRLAVVVSLRNTIEYCWNEYLNVVAECECEGVGEDNALGNYWKYACDDCYEVIDFSGVQSCPCTTDVHSPRFPVPDDIRSAFDNIVVSKPASFGC